MPSSKFLQANLTPTTISATYTGKNTDSLTIHVDNQNKTISGDVIWDSFLGEVAHKAYPGDQGRRNQEDIATLKTRFETSLESANVTHEQLQQTIVAIKNHVDTLEESTIEELTNQVEAVVVATNKFSIDLRNEIQRAKTAEDLLNTLVVSETEQRNILSTELNEKVDSSVAFLTNTIDNIENRCNEFNQEISSSINQIMLYLDKETTRSKQAESNLSKSISDIQTSLDSRIDVLEENKSAVESTITSLTDSISSLENTLRDEINNNLSVREDLDSRTVAVESKVDSTIKNINTLDSQVQLNSTQLKNISSKLKSVENSSENFQHTIADTLTELDRKLTTKIDEEINRSTVENEQLVELIQNHNNTVNLLKKDVQDIKVVNSTQDKSISTVSKQLELVKADIVSSKQQVTVQLDNCNSRLEEEHQLQLDTIKHVENQQRQLDSLSDLHKSQTAILQDSISKNDTRIVSLQDKVTQLTSESSSNKDDIDSLNTDIQEIEKLLNDEIVNRKVEDSKLSELQLKLQLEQSSQSNKLASLNNDVLSNTDSINDIYYQIDSNVNFLDTKIDSTNKNVTDVINTLHQVDRRLTDTINELDNKIHDNQVLIIHVDNHLHEIINSFFDKLNNEITKLTILLDNEVTLREHQITELTDVISNTETESLVRDTALLNRITILENSDKDVPLIPNDGSIVHLYGQHGKETIAIPFVDDITPECIVKRNSTGGINLPTLDDYAQDVAVPRKYVDDLVETIHKSILENLENNFKYDFIDGGSAPVNE